MKSIYLYSMFCTLRIAALTLPFVFTQVLSRIVAPDLDDDMEANENEFENEMSLMKSLASKMHDHTFGITSDPLTQFACVIS